MKVLITGSSGFIGEHLARRLVREGHRVLGLDLRPPPTEAATLSFQTCDLLDGTNLAAIISSFAPDAVIHLAARTDLAGKCLQDYAVNIQGVDNLITAIRNTPSVRRCIVTSSQLVCRVGYLPKHAQDYSPNTFYGQSKVMTESVVRNTDGGGVEWCLVRPTTVWGPGMNSHYQSFFRLIQQGRYFHVGHGPLYKTYGFVGSVVQQYLRLLEAPAHLIHRRMLYLADYQPLSLRQWADAFQREFHVRPIPTVPIPVAKLLARIGDLIDAAGFSKFPFNSFRLNNILTEYQYDMSPTQVVCGEVCMDLESAIRNTARWFIGLDSKVPHSITLRT